MKFSKIPNNTSENILVFKDVNSLTVDSDEANVRIFADDEDNVIVGSETGNSIIFAAGGDDKITVGNGLNIIHADNYDDIGGGDDIITVQGNSIIHGYGGSDTIFINAGGNTTFAGDDNDFISIDSDVDKQANTTYLGLGNDTINLLQGDSYVYDIGGDDTYVTLRDNQTLTDFQGNDFYNVNLFTDTGIAHKIIIDDLGVDDYDVVELVNISNWNEVDVSISEESISIHKGDTTLHVKNYIDENLGVELFQLAGGGAAKTLEEVMQMSPSQPEENNLATNSDDNIFLTQQQGINEVDALDGDDVVVGKEDFDALYGGAGNDYLYGRGGDDILHGNLGDDYIDGGSGNDIINGDAGDDTIIASAGEDSIYGGMGDDSLTGGSGADIFVIDDKGNDIVTDFNAADGDYLSIDATLIETMSISQLDDGTEISFANGDKTKLLGVFDITQDLINPQT
jgi:Ca2+-binding RTX toxin-like protein